MKARFMGYDLTTDARGKWILFRQDVVKQVLADAPGAEKIYVRWLIIFILLGEGS